MKKTVLVLCLTAGLMLLPACGGEADESPAEGGGPVTGEATAPGRTTLEFWYARGGDPGEAVQALVEQFNESHQNIKVTATYQGGYAEIMGKVWNAVYAEQTLPIQEGFKSKLSIIAMTADDDDLQEAARDALEEL